jgi:hypothetical protein
VNPLTYRLHAFYRAQFWVPIVIFPVAVVTVPVLLIFGIGGRMIFVGLLWLVWGVVGLVLGWRLMSRYADHLELTDEVLRWWAPLGHGEMKLADVRSIAPSPVGGARSVFAPVAGKPVFVQIQKGYADFVAEVQMRAPHASVRLGWYSACIEAFPGPRAFPR